MPKYLTVEQLFIVGACSNQRDLFQQVFGDRVEVTDENALKALDNNLSIAWACSALLPRAAYTSLQLETKDDYTALCNANDKTHKDLREEAASLTYEEGRRSHNERMDVFNAMNAANRRTYDEVIAKAFVVAYREQPEWEKRRIVTLNTLIEKRACSHYRVRFEEQFGRWVEVTEEAAVKWSMHFPMGWCITNLLTDGPAAEAALAEAHKLAGDRNDADRLAYNVNMKDFDGTSEDYNAKQSTYYVAKEDNERKLNEGMARVFARAYLAEPADPPSAAPQGWDVIEA